MTDQDVLPRHNGSSSVSQMKVGAVLRMNPEHEPNSNARNCTHQVLSSS